MATLTRYDVVRIVKPDGRPCYEVVRGYPSPAQAQSALGKCDAGRVAQEQYTVRPVVEQIDEPPSDLGNGDPFANLI